MPVMTGFEALKEIKQIPALQDVPIIAISASVLSIDSTLNPLAGCDAFLPKPVDEQRLLALLEKHLNLVWVYEELDQENDEGDQIKADQVEAPLVPPPPEELEVLYELAMLGSMQGIQKQADYLAKLNGTYIPFANKLRALARGFEDEQLLALVEQYMEDSQ